MKSLVFLCALALLGAAKPALCGVSAAAEGAQLAEEALAWVNGYRAAHGLPTLLPEPALERAAAYAGVLAASGRLAHRDGAGRDALARYRAAGGSAARVGEILGAGAGLAEIAAAWEASPAHAATALDPRWTRAGVGRARAQAGEVWVVLFAEQRVEGFAVVLEAGPAGGYLLAGRFRDAAAAAPVLLSGLDSLAPCAWDPGRREFLFRVPATAGSRYHRLGYRTAAGEFTLTNALFPALAAACGPQTP